MNTPTRHRNLTLLTITCLLLTSCSTNTAPATQRSATIFAAASLRGAFTDIAALHDQHHNTHTALSFGNSHALALAVSQGTEVDVLATADTEAMTVAQVSDWVPLASNSLTVAVAEGNPAGIGEVGDLEEVSVAQCVETAPCGVLAREFAETAGVTPQVVTQGTDVSHALSALTTGQVDVALVYATDVRATKEVDAVVLSGVSLPSTTYAIAGLGGSDVGAAFLDTVLSDAGQEILAQHGFDSPGVSE